MLKPEGNMWVKLLSFATLVLASSNMVQAAEPRPVLKNLEAITYQIWIFPIGEASKACKVDLANLETAFQFVANQSLRLRILSDVERTQRRDALFKKWAELDREWKGTGSKETEVANAKDQLDQYTDEWPTLSIIGQIRIIQGECLADVEAKLWITAPRIKLRWNEVVEIPDVKLWSKDYWVLSPVNDLSPRVTEIYERLLKDLVNDWSASQ